MKVSELTNQQVEFLIARILGHKASRISLPYVMVDDWNKPDTLIDGCRFQPITDEEQGNKIIERDKIEIVQTPEGWNACFPGFSINRPTHEVWSGCVYAQPSRLEAAMRCKATAAYPDEVPDDMLIDSELIDVLEQANMKQQYKRVLRLVAKL